MTSCNTNSEGVPSSPNLVRIGLIGAARPFSFIRAS